MEIKTTRTIEGVNLLPLSITDLYDFVATTLGYDKEKAHYDCTKVEVSDDIADLVEEKYRQVGQEKGLGEYDIKMSFGMDWCCSGPKVDEKLDNGTIVVYEGFIKEGE